MVGRGWIVGVLALRDCACCSVRCGVCESVSRVLISAFWMEGGREVF